jgi:hypothetical protein
MIKIKKETIYIIMIQLEYKTMIFLKIVGDK